MSTVKSMVLESRGNCLLDRWLPRDALIIQNGKTHRCGAHRKEEQLKLVESVVFHWAPAANIKRLLYPRQSSNPRRPNRIAINKRSYSEQTTTKTETIMTERNVRSAISQTRSIDSNYGRHKMIEQWRPTERLLLLMVVENKQTYRKDSRYGSGPFKRRAS